jgi:type II secretion system protein H
MGSREAVGHRGFTLLELIITLFVVALVTAIAVPTIGRSTEAVRVRADVAAFSAMLRHARERAITTRKVQAVVVDPAAHRVNIVSGSGEGEVRESRALPERLEITATPPPALTIRFDPQGVSSGGEFRLAIGTIAYRVTVDALTGRVRSDRL